MRFVGIDIASRTHVVAVVNEAGDVLVKPTPITEDAVGYRRLFEILGEPEDVLIAVEATGHYSRNLVAVLTGRGFPVALLNPVRTHRFALEDLARAKTDAIDAIGIARFAAQKRPLSIPANDHDVDEIREIVRLHDRLLQDFGDRTRQLHRLVHLCFPEFTRYVASLDSQRATAILRLCPDLASFERVGFPTLSVLRFGRRTVGEALARTLVDAASVSVGQHKGQPFRDEMLLLCEDMDLQRGRLKELRADIEARIARHTVGSLLTTIEGLGALSAARILATAGDPARFRNAAAFASYVGVVPRTNRSGLRQSNRARLCPTGHARLRTKLFMTTLSVVRVNPWLRPFYHRLRQCGKPPKVALMASLRKLLTAIHAVAKTRRPFVPNIT